MVYSNVSQTVLTRGPLLFASKNIFMDPHIFARVNVVCSNDRYTKLKKLYFRTDFRWLGIQ